MTDNTEHGPSGRDLDRMLARLADGDPVASAGLLHRIVADADAAAAMPRKPVRRRRELFTALGGWPSLTGLVTATAAGIWLGFAQPGPVGGLADGVIPAAADYDLGDLMPGYETVLVEG